MNKDWNLSEKLMWPQKIIQPCMRKSMAIASLLQRSWVSTCWTPISKEPWRSPNPSGKQSRKRLLTGNGERAQVTLSNDHKQKSTKKKH